MEKQKQKPDSRLQLLNAVVWANETISSSSSFHRLNIYKHGWCISAERRSLAFAQSSPSQPVTLFIRWFLKTEEHYKVQAFPSRSSLFIGSGSILFSPPRFELLQFSFWILVCAYFFIFVADSVEKLPKLVEDILQTSINTGPRGALRVAQGIQAVLGVGGEWLSDLSKVIAPLISDS